MPSLEDKEIDSTILKHFNAQTKEELFVLPQFSCPYSALEDEETDLHIQFNKYKSIHSGNSYKN